MFCVNSLSRFEEVVITIQSNQYHDCLSSALAYEHMCFSNEYIRTLQGFWSFMKRTFVYREGDKSSSSELLIRMNTISHMVAVFTVSMTLVS
jgi:hypothetical protein